MKTIVLVVIVGLLAVALLALHKYFSGAKGTPLGFGHPSSHADTVDPEKQRKKLEDTADLAAQQSASKNNFNKDNFIN